MNKKVIKLLTTLIATFLFVSITACKKEEFKQKPISGIDAMFDESLGYYNESPSVIEENGVRYVYYTKNVTKNNDEKENLVVRKGEFKNGKWNYNSSSVVLSPSNDGWDSAKVFQADVIKGNFVYEGKNYSYLMAYSGTDSLTSRKGAQIGLAVSETPTGTFKKISDKPFISWDAKDYSQHGELLTNGACEPSLINYDGNSQIIMFYSLFNPTTSHSCKYLLLDLSSDLKNLSSRNSERGNLLSKEGIQDMSTDPACISADFSISEDKKILYAVRDYYPVPTINPAVAEAVQVISAPFEILKETISDTSPKWNVINDKISALDTAVWDNNEKMGYDCVYSACIISNEKGYVGKNVNISFTSCALASSLAEYKYSPMIHEFNVIKGV